ncbi:MAG: sigma-70 family RNA polymerase sigma factor [Acidobacteriota bacterium]|nr:sigma-70 family RNA polymerase sigma factor [Acidobacteriota bacterium]
MSPATMPLSFDQLVTLLDRPPYEPCESELQYLTRVQYDRAFTDAVRLHYRGVRHLIAHLAGSWAVAEDLTQEVFTNVYRAGTSFDKPYIYRAARNAVYTESRRARRDHIMRLRLAGLSPVRGEREVRDVRPLQDAELFERAREEALARAIERLPEHFRVPLLLLAEGKSYKQMVKLTRTNEGTVKSRICRAKVLLRRRLRVYLDGSDRARALTSDLSNARHKNRP